MMKSLAQMFYCFQYVRLKRTHCDRKGQTQCWACAFVERNGFVWKGRLP